MAEILKIIPILIATWAMIIVSFMKIKKQDKKIAIIITFMLWLVTAGITLGQKMYLIDKEKNNI